MPGTLVGAGVSRDTNLTNKVLTPLQLPFYWGIRMMNGGGGRLGGAVG